MLSNCSAGEDSRESLGQQGDQTVNPKGNQPWILVGSTDAEAEAPILWPQDENRWLNGKDLDAGKDWRQEEKRVTGWVGWMASLMQRTWTWANSRWWRTRKPGMLQSMWLQSWTLTGDWIATLVMIAVKHVFQKFAARFIIFIFYCEMTLHILLSFF